MRPWASDLTFWALDIITLPGLLELSRILCICEHALSTGNCCTAESLEIVSVSVLILSLSRMVFTSSSLPMKLPAGGSTYQWKKWLGIPKRVTGTPCFTLPRPSLPIYWTSGPGLGTKHLDMNKIPSQDAHGPTEGERTSDQIHWASWDRCLARERESFSAMRGQRQAASPAWGGTRTESYQVK